MITATVMDTAIRLITITTAKGTHPTTAIHPMPIKDTTTTAMAITDITLAAASVSTLVSMDVMASIIVTTLREDITPTITARTIEDLTTPEGTIIPTGEITVATIDSTLSL